VHELGQVEPVGCAVVGDEVVHLHPRLDVTAGVGDLADGGLPLAYHDPVADREELLEELLIADIFIELTDGRTAEHHLLVGPAALGPPSHVYGVEELVVVDDADTDRVGSRKFGIRRESLLEEAVEDIAGSRDQRLVEEVPKAVGREPAASGLAKMVQIAREAQGPQQAEVAQDVLPAALVIREGEERLPVAHAGDRTLQSLERGRLLGQIPRYSSCPSNDSAPRRSKACSRLAASSFKAEKVAGSKVQFTNSMLTSRMATSAKPQCTRWPAR